MSSGGQAGGTPVLILGGGVNGCAAARELLLNGISVILVDRVDLAAGATAKSSRLIHGGLRYLEYGDWRLVREALAERRRLLALAPHRVRPLRLYMPVRHLWGGLGRTLARLLGLAVRAKGRGYWLLRLGLRAYDRLAADPSLPPAGGLRRRPGRDPLPALAPEYGWLCAFSDAQMPYPERFCQDLLADARQLASERSLLLAVYPHHEATVTGNQASLHPTGGGQAVWQGPIRAVINATGAWGDLTREQAGLPGQRQFAGTRGSHFFTRHPGLLAALGETALYAEAADGRLVFLLPVPEGIMVGTTDLPLTGRPEEAVASTDELNYLLGLVNELFPEFKLSPADITMHYCGVRPLPVVPAHSPAAITRGHWVARQPGPPLTLTIVGGKLTVARSLAEQVVHRVLHPLPGRRLNTRQRPLPGGQDYPSDPVARAQRQVALAVELSLPVAAVATCWELFGSRADAVLREACVQQRALLPGTQIPLGVVHWVLANEWAETLEDLVERRLLLIYQEPLARRTIQALADLLVTTGKLPPGQQTSTLAAATARWHQHYGKVLVD